MMAENPFISDLQDICRACMKKPNAGNFLSLSADPVRAAFVKCTNIYVSSNDKLPLKICKQCFQKCADFLKFKTMTSTNDQSMKTLLLKRAKGEDTSGLVAHDPVIKVERVSEEDNSYYKEEDLLDDPMGLQLHDLEWDDVDMEMEGAEAEAEPSDSFIYVNLQTFEDMEIRCPICLAVTVGQRAFDGHVLTHTETKGRIFCSLCGNSYTRRMAYQDHMYSHTDLRFKCNQCDKAYGGPKALKSHQRKDHSVFIKKKPRRLLVDEAAAAVEEPSQPYASEEPEPEDSLNGEILGTTGFTNNIKCPICAKDCSGKVHFEAHIASKHISGQTKQCPICNREFSKWENVKHHMFKHTDAKLACQICQKEYTNPHSLSNHMRRIHPETPSGAKIKTHYCEICGWYFRSLTTLQQHFRDHESGAVLAEKCDICDATFASAAGLEEHIATKHERGDLFPCRLCHQSLPDKRLLTVHLMEVHTTGRQCLVCDENFEGNYGVLEGHMLNHNRIKHKCPVCGFRAQSRIQLEEHHNSHTGNKPFVCELCGKPFGSKRYLRVHRMAVHGKPRQIEEGH